MPGIKGMRWGIRRNPGLDGLVKTPDHLGRGGRQATKTDKQVSSETIKTGGRGVVRSLNRVGNVKVKDISRAVIGTGARLVGKTLKTAGSIYIGLVVADAVGREVERAYRLLRR